jgi:hypothetical protein
MKNREYTATELIDFALGRLAEIDTGETFYNDAEKTNGIERTEDVIRLLEHAKIAMGFR